MRSSRAGKGGSVSAQPAELRQLQRAARERRALLRGVRHAGAERGHRARRGAAERDRSRSGDRRSGDAALVRAAPADRPLRARHSAVPRRRGTPRPQRLGCRARPARACPALRGRVPGGRPEEAGHTDRDGVDRGGRFQRARGRATRRRRTSRAPRRARRSPGVGARRCASRVSAGSSWGSSGRRLYSSPRPMASAERGAISALDERIAEPQREASESPPAPRSGSRPQGARCSRPRSGAGGRIASDFATLEQDPRTAGTAERPTKSASRDPTRPPSRPLLALLTAAPAAG